MSKTKVAIHQPNFVPWMPYYEKMASVDVFVILTQCQFWYEGYQRRFNHLGKWYTMPVSRGHLEDKIIDKKYVDPARNWNKIKCSLGKDGKALSIYDECVGEFLAVSNIAIIMKTMEMLGISTEIAFDYPTEKTKTERLIQLIKMVNGDTYLSGTGSLEYLDVELMADHGITVEWQDRKNNSKFGEISTVQWLNK
ncbi:MAG TPA: WbqC family protein [Saccharofermentans sp.]|nr:WbqC family protein [Saccharofermentans sp.]